MMKYSHAVFYPHVEHVSAEVYPTYTYSHPDPLGSVGWVSAATLRLELSYDQMHAHVLQYMKRNELIQFKSMNLNQ